MNKIEKLLEKHFTKLGCKCDVMDNTKQYQASLNAINEALTLYGVVGQSEQLKCDCCNGTGMVEGDYRDELESCLTCNGRGTF